MATHAPSSPAQPFAIGLKPLTDDNFLIVDDALPEYLDEKRALYDSDFTNLFRALPDTYEVQNQVQDLVVACLQKHHPGIPYALSRNDRDRARGCKLAEAALLVQDDLVIMRRFEDGWRLAAASLCFPSSWNLAEKFDRPMQEIHAPVPLSPQMGERIHRIFDNLRPGLSVWRANWSLDGDGDLRHDRPLSHRATKREKLTGEIWFRSEYQTLHRLTQKDILFTIRIATSPLEEMLNWPDGKARIGELAQQYRAMTDAELRYKGIAEGAEKLLRWLDQNGT